MKERLADPRFAKKVHACSLVFWLVFSIPAAIFLSNSLPFVVWLSLYAIVVTHWSSWQATRTEILQADAEKKLQEDHERLKKIDPDHPQEEVTVAAPKKPELGEL
jgi:hypothetical protein